MKNLLDEARGSCIKGFAKEKGESEAPLNKALGIILVVLGLFGLAWGGFTYTTREKVMDIGPIHATRDKTHNVLLPPIAGAVALLGGIALLAARGQE